MFATDFPRLKKLEVSDEATMVRNY